MSLVFGNDPSIRSAGLAIVDCSGRRPRHVWSATVKTAANVSTHSRMAKLWEKMSLAVVTYQPALIAMENPDNVQVGARERGETNATTSLFLRSTGIAHCVALAHGLPFAEVDAAAVKRAVGAIGRIITKAQVKRCVRMVCDDVPSTTSEHVDHAIATAIAGAKMARTMRLEVEEA